MRPYLFEVEVTSRFHFVMLTMDKKSQLRYLINLGRPFVILKGFRYYRGSSRYYKKRDVWRNFSVA